MTAQRSPITQGAAPGDKGLRGGALGFISNLVIGVAATAPGAGVALALGLVVGVVGFQGPALMLVAFVPMLLIASAYYHLNRADPDCGTSFSWVTKAMGPQLGWLAGWAMVVALGVVLANLAELTGAYTFLLVGWDSAAESTVAVTLLGVIWLVILTAVVTWGISLAARAQLVMLALEIAALTLFSAVALVKVYVDSPPGSAKPSLSWISPFAIDNWSALATGVVLALFLYWGWDSTVATNEEAEESRRNPGLAAVLSTIIVVSVYVITSYAALAFAGRERLVENADDVFSALGSEVLGTPLDKLLVLAVLTSAAASAQTAILLAARTGLSMSLQGAAPASLARVSLRFRTPVTAALVFSLVSIVWYVGLTIVSEDVIADSIAALGLLIAFYYALTGFACAIYYRRRLLASAKSLLIVGVAPVVGAGVLTWALVRSVVDLADPANAASGAEWFGLGAPLVIGIVLALLGAVLMAAQWLAKPPFFRRHTEVLGDELAPMTAEAPGAIGEGV